LLKVQRIPTAVNANVQGEAGIIRKPYLLFHRYISPLLLAKRNKYLLPILRCGIVAYVISMVGRQLHLSDKNPRPLQQDQLGQYSRLHSYRLMHC
jgi:hypothetical protein